MNKNIYYKGFEGNVFQEDSYFYGLVPSVEDAILSFEGDTYEELIENFHDCIECYLSYCETHKNLP